MGVELCFVRIGLKPCTNMQKSAEKYLQVKSELNLKNVIWTIARYILHFAGA